MFFFNLSNPLSRLLPTNLLLIKSRVPHVETSQEEIRELWRMQQELKQVHDKQRQSLLHMRPLS